MHDLLVFWRRLYVNELLGSLIRGHPLYRFCVVRVFQSRVRFLRSISQRLLVKKRYTVDRIAGWFHFMAGDKGHLLLCVDFLNFKLRLFLLVGPHLLLKIVVCIGRHLAVRNWSGFLSDVLRKLVRLLLLESVLNVPRPDYQLSLRWLDHSLVLHLLFHLLQRAEAWLLLWHPVLLAATEEVLLRLCFVGHFGL